MQPGNPLNDSVLGGVLGKGVVDEKKLEQLAEVWGKLPEKERAQAIRDLTRDMPPKYRDAIETYMKNLQNRSGK